MVRGIRSSFVTFSSSPSPGTRCGIERDFRKVATSLGGHREPTATGQYTLALIQTVVQRDAGEVVIIKPCAPQAFVVPVKAEWANQVETVACVRAYANDVAGIWRNFGLEEYDVHGQSFRALKLKFLHFAGQCIAPPTKQLRRIFLAPTGLA